MTDQRILSRVAELYYIHDINQIQIARKFNFSKAKICRLIKEAKKKKIIEFNIKKDPRSKVELEESVEKKFNLQEVIVYSEIGSKQYDNSLILEEIGSIGASFIERIIKDDMNIAIGGGKTLYNVFKKVRPKRKYKVDIFSTLGGISLSKAEYQNNDLIKMLCERIGGTCHPIYLPIMLKKLIDRDTLLDENELLEIVKSPSLIDYYIAGVGPVSRKSHYYTLGFFNDKFIKSLKDKNIVGEIGLNFFDNDGNFIESGIEDRVVNLRIDTIKKIKNKVVIATGKEKIISLKGLLRSGIPDVLTTDENTAREIIKD